MRRGQAEVDVQGKAPARFTACWTVIALLMTIWAGGVVADDSVADDSVADDSVLFRNVRIFDGVNSELKAGEVLVEGSHIKQVSSALPRARR